MKNLEQALRDFRGERFDTEAHLGALIEAARLDCEAARAEGYRQGVEDAIIGAKGDLELGLLAWMAPIIEKAARKNVERIGKGNGNGNPND